MEVILRQAVDNLGHPGDIVDVSSGYARNFLLPRGFAYEATPGNLKRIGQEKARLEAAENERRDAAQQLATKLEEVSLTFSAKVGEEGKLFGSVTNIHIEKALKAKGLNVDRRKIQLAEPIKSAGDYDVPVRLSGDITVPLKVSVVSDG